MYWLLGIDTVLRIAAAMALLFVIVPALAWKRPAQLGRMEWFWWNLGAGLTLLTLAGQLFTLLNIASFLTYAILLAAIILFCRAYRRGMGPVQLIAGGYRGVILFALNVADGRIDLRARIETAARDIARRISAQLRNRSLAVWAAIIAVAAVTRFYRPFATANLGFSDTYVHLYLMRLLDAGRQVDPAWGPYPRGMHMLLLAIERLTNADPILLMNFFGAFSGVLITISVAYAARRVTRSNVAAFVAGLAFATMIGGASQYLVMGGSISTVDRTYARSILMRSYAEMDPVNMGEFDVLFTAFQRQTSTLPQELAIVLLFPAALFLLDWFRERDRWRLTGFAGCTAAIAAIHSGVVVPLALLCAAAAVAALIERVTNVREIARIALSGAAAVALGSTWILGFIRYHHAGGTETISANSHVGSTALYYFPFLRPFAGGNAGEAPTQVAYATLTPFLIVMVLIAVVLGLRAARARDGSMVWLTLTVVIFTLTHGASSLGIPEIVEVRRNVTWLAMAVAALLGVTISIIVSIVIEMAKQPRLARAVPAVVLAAWAFTVPNLFGTAIRTQLLDYSGYGGTALAVVRLEHDFQPFTWTLVTYGQEYPMVLGTGFHVAAADFLDRFDPAESPLPIPTPLVFIAVEKKPHRFQINTWSARFDRGAIEERLQTWCTLYRMTHSDMGVWQEDGNVRVYAIRRTAQVMARMADGRTP
ncbi:MAG TPA: hypothetical protein VHX14_13315 [Thermoanaerobaculia bacterium]|jgi:hypothetical protein|nr:hypothetical protein [Thermoanaerobaculia bacterium]